MSENDMTADDATTTGAPGGSADAGVQSDYRPPASQADLDRIIQQRLARESAKYADYDSLREKAQQWEELAAASRTDTERAIQEAQETAWNAAMAQAVPRVVTAEFRAEAKGILSPEQLDALLEDLNLTKYATDDGAPDVERIRSKIAALAPAEPSRPGIAQRRPVEQMRPGATPGGVESEDDVLFAQLFGSQ